MMRRGVWIRAASACGARAGQARGCVHVNAACCTLPCWGSRQSELPFDGNLHPPPRPPKQPYTPVRASSTSAFSFNAASKEEARDRASGVIGSRVREPKDYPLQSSKTPTRPCNNGPNPSSSPWTTPRAVLFATFASSFAYLCAITDTATPFTFWSHSNAPLNPQYATTKDLNKVSPPASAINTLPALNNSSIPGHRYPPLYPR